MCTDLRPASIIYAEPGSPEFTMPHALQMNLYLARYENGRFISDGYFRMEQAERDEVDRWLVETNHPLAFEPGTQERRITALIQQYGSEL